MVSHMFGIYFTLYHHIIYIDLNTLAQLWFKHPSHHPLVDKPCIFQTKGHHFVVVVSGGSEKSCIFLITQGQWYLVVPLKGIQEAHLRMAHDCIHQLVYPRHREGIFQAILI